MEFLAVFKVFTQNRVRRSGLHRRSLTFQFLVVEVPAVFLVFTQNNAQRRCTFLRNAFLEQIVAGGDFPSRRAGPRFVLPRQGSTAAGAELIADITSAGDPHGFLPGQVSTASPVHVDMHLPDSVEWVELYNDTGRTYF